MHILIIPIGVLLWFIAYKAKPVINEEMTYIFEEENLSVVWESEGILTKRLFSYCINREDIENAILQGP